MLVLLVDGNVIRNQLRPDAVDEEHRNHEEAARQYCRTRHLQNKLRMRSYRKARINDEIVFQVMLELRAFGLTTYCT